MSSDATLPPGPPEDNGNGAQGNGSQGDGGRLIDQPIEDELKEAYLRYSMSVIVSRALPDVRDGLKPSQRRILVAMNDLNLGPTAARVKCAKISGDTSGNYHPHGESVIYPTLVRMAQEWNMRHVLIDKQGNFGSIAGLPPAAMRYTEARLAKVANFLLGDIDKDTVDFTPNYDASESEPQVLPARFPNLLVNGAGGADSRWSGCLRGISVQKKFSLPEYPKVLYPYFSLSTYIQGTVSVKNNNGNSARFLARTSFLPGAFDCRYNTNCNIMKCIRKKGMA